MIISRVLLLFFSLPIFFGATASAMQVSLEQAIEMAVTENKQLKIYQWQNAALEADSRRVDSEFGLAFNSLVAVAPIYEASGNALVSVEDKSSWGTLLLGEIGAQYPLLTWGRRAQYRRAIARGKKVKDSALRQERNLLVYQTKEAYWGVVLAKQVLEFIQEGKKDLNEASERIKKKGRKSDRYRLEIFAAQLEAKEAEVKQLLRTAQNGLALRMGIDVNNEILPEPVDTFLPGKTSPVQGIEHYVGLAMNQRPELSQLRDGIEAKKHLASAENKGRLPVLGVGAKYKFAYAENRQRQRSVFAYDPFNVDTFEAGVGIQWQFNWDLQSAKAAKHRAEANELEAKQAFAQNGIAVEVRRAYFELEAAAVKVKNSNKAFKAAKKWLRREMIGQSAGLGSVANLVEAYTAWADTAKDNFESRYNYLKARATLAQKAGLQTL